MTNCKPVKLAEVPLEPEAFVRDVLASLTENLERVVGIESARGFIHLVGQQIGLKVDESYKRSLGVAQFTPAQLAEVLVDLKDRIGGGFSIESVSDSSITLVNSRCPFGERVLGRTSLCMMTSNVFGLIAAESFGEASVGLEETIAGGATGCRVVVHFGKSVEGEDRYFKLDEEDRP